MKRSLISQWSRIPLGANMILVGLALSLLAAPAASQVTPAGKERPHVVVFLADDLGWADVGFHDGEIETPNIDRLAEEGVVLDHFYSAPICSPTRAALMTGRDPLKLGLGYDQIHPWYNAGLPPNAQTLPRSFREAGYQTGMVGKWHLGHTQEHQLPNQHGFEHFHGHLHTNTDYYTHQRESGHDLQENGRSVDLNGQYLTHIQAREAVRFLKERDRKKNFFLYVPFTAPHSPMQAPQETIDHYAHLPQKNYRRTYAAMVHEMDQAVGAILKELDEQGVADNTLVLFFSDNGGSNIFGGVNTPLRGQKAEAFEGGIRVPAVLRWPKRLPPHTEFDPMMTVMDVYPTLANAAGIALEPAPALDGLDLWPAIVQEADAPERGPVFFASEIPIPGLIQLAVIDEPWKLVQIIREGQTETKVASFLFNLQDDPFEKNNLLAKKPEIATRLAQEIRGWRSQHPMAGIRGTLVAHPGWVAPHDWAAAVTSGELLQPSWKNELPFSKALIDATAERGVLVDEATARELEALEKKSRSGWSPPGH